MLPMEMPQTRARQVAIFGWHILHQTKLALGRGRRPLLQEVTWLKMAVDLLLASLIMNSGSFDVIKTNKKGRDHRGKGLLQYVGEHHLQFAETNEWFLKAGADSPENFLAYEDFDNTPNFKDFRKTWAPHEQDYQHRRPYLVRRKRQRNHWRHQLPGGKGNECIQFPPNEY